MNYPAYTREEKLSCKLSEKNIADIRHRRENGETLRSLAALYEVCIDTICTWTNDEYRKKKREKNRIYQAQHPRSTDINREYKKRFEKRKKILKPTFPKWMDQQNKKCPYYKNLTNKYHTDTAYRKRILEHMKKYYANKKQKEAQ